MTMLTPPRRCVPMLLYLLMNIVNQGQCQSDLKVFPMHSLCGKKITLKHEYVFTAEVLFDPSEMLNASAPKTAPSYTHQSTRTGGDHVIGSCDLEIETWSFMNKMLFYFTEIHLDPDCDAVHLELLDGYLPDHSPPIHGLPSFLCHDHVGNVAEKIFRTSNRNLLIRFHNNRPGNLDAYFKLTIAAYHEGKCSSYEHECDNGHCIMDELVCNGHNPCGDHSDCPVKMVAQVEDGGQLATNQDHVMLIAVICMSSSIVLLVIVAILGYKFYVKRRKHRRNDPLMYGGQSTATSGRPHVPLRTISQYETERLNAPPSYNSLPIQEENTTDIEPLNDITSGDDVCAQPEGSTEPPSYTCVMLHRDKFYLDQSNTQEPFHVKDET